MNDVWDWLAGGLTLFVFFGGIGLFLWLSTRLINDAINAFEEYIEDKIAERVEELDVLSADDS